MELSTLLLFIAVGIAAVLAQVRQFYYQFQIVSVLASLRFFYRHWVILVVCFYCPRRHYLV